MGKQLGPGSRPSSLRNPVFSRSDPSWEPTRLAHCECSSDWQSLLQLVVRVPCRLDCFGVGDAIEPKSVDWKDVTSNRSCHCGENFGGFSRQGRVWRAVCLPFCAPCRPAAALGDGGVRPADVADARAPSDRQARARSADQRETFQMKYRSQGRGCAGGRKRGPLRYLGSDRSYEAAGQLWAFTRGGPGIGPVSGSTSVLMRRRK